MSLNIQKLKVTLNTNIPKQKSIEFTKDVLYHPESNSFKDIEKYPYITTKQLYPEKFLFDLDYDEIVNIFFNRDKFERMLLENKPPNTETDIQHIYKTNIMTMLELLFSTKYFIVNNIHQSLDIITHNESTKSLFYNPFNTKFSYIKVNGKPYTVTKAIWLNDIVNHPKYNELMKEVRSVADEYIEKEYPVANINKERQLPFKVPVKFDDISYRLRSVILPKYRHPYRESSNKELQKYIIGAKNKTDSNSDDVSKFYELFDNIYERYMNGNKDVEIGDKLLNVGIDNINIGYDNSYPKKEIFVLLDVIEGEVNDINKKEVYCPYTNDYLGNLLNNLVYKVHSTKVLDKPRTMYSISEKKSDITSTDTKMDSSSDKKIMSDTTDKKIMSDTTENVNKIETLFYSKIFNRTDEKNTDLLNKTKPILQDTEILTFIKNNNTELYTIINKSLNTSFKSTDFMNQIRRSLNIYQTELNISNDYLTQPGILPDKIQETKKSIVLYELYIRILESIKSYEDTKPASSGGSKSSKRKKKVLNNTKKNKK